MKHNNAKINGFITNLGKYNEGVLIGEWISFPISEDELSEVYERIGINLDEPINGVWYEETFFTDWDNEIDFNFGEYPDIDEVNEIADWLESLDRWEDETLEAALEIWDFSEIYENGLDAYSLYSDVNSNYDLGYYWIEESGCYDIKALGSLANYIDYEAFGRDVAMDADGGFTKNGFIEYIG